MKNFITSTFINVIYSRNIYKTIQWRTSLIQQTLLKGLLWKMQKGSTQKGGEHSFLRTLDLFHNLMQMFWKRSFWMKNEMSGWRQCSFINNYYYALKTLSSDVLSLDNHLVNIGMARTPTSLKRRESTWEVDSNKYHIIVMTHETVSHSSEYE